MDFFAWYAHGRGETVDLVEVGLLDDFRDSKQIKPWTEALRLEMNAMAKGLAAMVLSTGRSEFSISFNRSLRYNFGGGFVTILYKVIMGMSAP